MKKLYLVTKIDKKDKVTRQYVTANSRRDKVLDDSEIVTVEEVTIPIDDIKAALEKYGIEKHIIQHVITDLTTK